MFHKNPFLEALTFQLYPGGCLIFISDKSVIKGYTCKQMMLSCSQKRLPENMHTEEQQQIHHLFHKRKQIHPFFQNISHRPSLICKISSFESWITAISDVSDDGKHCPLS